MEARYCHQPSLVDRRLGGSSRLTLIPAIIGLEPVTAPIEETPSALHITGQAETASPIVDKKLRYEHLILIRRLIFVPAVLDIAVRGEGDAFIAVICGDVIACRAEVSQTLGKPRACRRLFIWGFDDLKLLAQPGIDFLTDRDPVMVSISKLEQLALRWYTAEQGEMIGSILLFRSSEARC
jgi:hypothetical protein